MEATLANLSKETPIAEAGMRRLQAVYVEDLMTRDLFTLLEGDNLRIADEIMKWKAIRHIPVVREDGSLAGLITHRDILRTSISTMAAIGQDDQDRLNQGIPASTVMNHNVMTVPPKTPLDKAARLMFERKIGCLPVISKGKLVGIITEADFVKFFIENQILKES